jgi:hypothetical protein
MVSSGLSERVIGVLATAPRVTRSEVDAAAETLHLSRAMVYRLLARYRRDPHTSTLLANSPGRRTGSRGLDERIEQIVACLLLPTYFADPITASSHLGRPDTNARLLDVLGPENVDTLLGRAHRWPVYFRLRMEKAARSRPISRDVKRQSTV